MKDKEIIQPINLSPEQFNDLENPIKLNKYLNDIKKNPVKNVVKCDICGKTYTKQNKWHHKSTQYHQTYAKMNQKMRDFLFSK